jgi:hypothetical protein
MPTQWRTIIKISYDQLTQAVWTLVQINEELLESMNMCHRIGVDHMLLDTAGNERHDVITQHKRRTIPAESCLGVIALDERSLGPIGSIRARRTETEGFTAPQRPWRHDILMVTRLDTI